MIFDHIGVVVPDIATGRGHLEAVLGVREWTGVFADEGIGVYVQFGQDASGICYELIAPLGDESPVRQALATGSRILNHVAYRVSDIASEAGRLRSAGCLATGLAKPAVAYNDAKVQFFITPSSFLVELIEAPSHVHQFR